MQGKTLKSPPTSSGNLVDVYKTWVHRSGTHTGLKSISPAPLLTFSPITLASALLTSRLKKSEILGARL